MGGVPGPKMGPFWGLEMARQIHWYRLYEDIPISMLCTDVRRNIRPKMGPFWGIQMAHLSWFQDTHRVWDVFGVKTARFGMARRDGGYRG